MSHSQYSFLMLKISYTRFTNSTISFAAHNQVAISGFSSTTFNYIIGGVVMDDGSSVTDNTITITTTGKTYGGIYGGDCDSGTPTGDLFTGNTLNLNAGNTINQVGNVEKLNFLTSGDAGIGTLNTAPTNAANLSVIPAGVIINTGANAVTFGAQLIGDGGVTKGDTTDNEIDSGILVLTNANNTYSGATNVKEGTLKLSNGGAFCFGRE
ncbi:MAG: autotransporter-associated beta strand repeat-containing protein [Planctomycetaceae bacterium]|nr:autotransporter-associated beta strand repeat-containing protein [Planctomycetaceae bacterium]